MISDSVRGIIVILIKIQIIIALSIVFFYTWCFAWIHIQATTLCNTVTQVVTENNYIPKSKLSELQGMITNINKSPLNTPATPATPAVLCLGVSNVKVECNGHSYDFDASSPSPSSSKRYQSGNLLTIKVNYCFPTFKFIFTGLGSGQTIRDFATRETTYKQATIVKRTIGMKYYPDLDGSGSDSGEGY